MKEKSSNNKKANPGRGKRIALWAVIGFLTVVLLAVLLIWWALAYTEGLENADPETSFPAATAPADDRPAAENLKDVSVQLNAGLQIINVGAYTGAFVEDGTNEIVSGVLMLVVANSGEDAIEYAQIQMPVGDAVAQFSVSTLMPGDKAVLLEKNRMAYSGQEDTEKAEANTVAVFDELPTLCEDQLEIQILDGAINVSNISGEDIDGEIVIYYKNSAADLYYGGITFRVRIEDGIAADEVKQIMASHFSASGSKIVFVTIN